MPEPNRAPWVIEPALAAITVGQLVEQQGSIGLACHACRHEALWPAAELERRFSRRQAATIQQLARRLRCGRCRSDWIEVARARAPEAGRPC